MTKKKTTEEFVADAIARHGVLYGYSETVYVDMKTKVRIWCNKHESFFEQTPNSHLMGNGCPDCGREKSAKMRSEPRRVSFVSEATAISPEYDYSKVEYVCRDQKVEIVCNVHGSFWIRPRHILQGKGCIKCATDYCAKLKKNKAAKKFVAQALAMKEHSNRSYSYEKTEYTGSNKKLIVTCLKHGDFLITASNHLSGRGCPDCGEHGYRKNKAGSLYVLVCDDLTKVGITNHKAQQRSNHVSHHYGKKFSVAFEVRFEDGNIPLNIETALLADLRQLYSQPSDYFVGGSECFYGVDRNALLARISELTNSFQTEGQNSSTNHNLT